MWREAGSGGYANPCCGYGYERGLAGPYPYPYPWYTLLARLESDGGLHFNVSCANIKQLEAFSVTKLMQVVKQKLQNAPLLWGMLDEVLSARATETSGTWGGDDTSEQDLYWNALEGGDMRRGRRSTDRLDKQRAIRTIVSNSESMAGQNLANGLPF